MCFEKVRAAVIPWLDELLTVEARFASAWPTVWQLTCARNGLGYPEMLMTIFVILLVMWLLGMVTSYTLYGYIHILLIIAVAVLLIRLIQGRRVL
jgi:hypothetical protein